jgi:aspartate/methionine/tyrosine aminotransferase
LKSDPSRLPFKSIVQCNVGNPHLLLQRPITFFRQVLALLEMPWLLEGSSTQILSAFPSDVVDRAKTIHSRIGPLTAYSHSKGFLYIRQRIAEYIAARDGYPTDPEHIFMSSGASPAIANVLQLLISKPNIGILISRPQYPLYSATITVLNGQTVYYDLDEDHNWSLSCENILSSLRKARKLGIDVRALSVINPGNPTGSVLSEENLKDVIKLCKVQSLVLLADEVYQANVYYPETKPFISARKVLKNMGEEYQNLELFSFHSVSKGITGECGRRGGYVECTGISNAVLKELYKLFSIGLCSSTLGQVMFDMMLFPPQPGDPSFDLYAQESNGIYESLKRRSILMTETLQKLEGVSCQTPEGSMYVFPRYNFPDKFIEEAKRDQLAPDLCYALKLLQATGICAVQGSGFGQKEGTYHLRFTFLPPEETFEHFLALLREFHEKFMDSYRQ